MLTMSVCVHTHDLGGSGGMPPQEIFKMYTLLYQNTVIITVQTERKKHVI